jgi:hypothetical protein
MKSVKMRIMKDLLTITILAVLALAAGGLFQWLAEAHLAKWVSILLVTVIVLIVIFVGAALTHRRTQ